MQGIQQRHKSPMKNPATLLHYPQLCWNPCHFSRSHYLLLTAAGRRVNGTKHNKRWEGLKYLIKYVHIGTQITKQHSSANKNNLYTCKKQTNKNNNWSRSIFLHVFKIHDSGELWTLQDIIKPIGCHKLVKHHLMSGINNIMSTSELSVFMSMRTKGQLPRAIPQTWLRSPPLHEIDCTPWELFIYLEYEKSLDYSDRAVQSQGRWTSPYVSALQTQAIFGWAGHSEQDTQNVSWAAIENRQLWKEHGTQNQIFTLKPLWAIWELWCSRRTDICFP